MLLCAVLLVAAVALLVSGLGGGFVFVPLLLCGLMMGGMIWMMMRSGRHDR